MRFCGCVPTPPGGRQGKRQTRRKGLFFCFFFFVPRTNHKFDDDDDGTPDNGQARKHQNKKTKGTAYGPYYSVLFLPLRRPPSLPCAPWRQKTQKSKHTPDAKDNIAKAHTGKRKKMDGFGVKSMGKEDRNMALVFFLRPAGGLDFVATGDALQFGGGGVCGWECLSVSGTTSRCCCCRRTRPCVHQTSGYVAIGHRVPPPPTAAHDWMGPRGGQTDAPRQWPRPR